MKVKNAQIFLCHAKEDKGKVHEVYNLLQKEGFEPWLDKENLLPGQLWDEEIQKAIKSSKFMLIFLSKISVSKQGYIQKEFKLGLDTLKEIPSGNIFIIPVRLDDCAVPLEFQRIHYVDLFESDGVSKIIQSLNVGLERIDIRKKNSPVEITDIEEKQISNEPQSDTVVLWRRDVDASGNGSYSLYLNGEPIHSESKLIWSGTDDAIIFVPKSNTYYELKDYKKHSDGKLRTGILTNFLGNALWQRDVDASGNGSYSLYLNGEPIHSESKLIWSGTDDAIIFVPKSSTHYELKGYKKYSDGKLRTATLTTFDDNVLWRRDVDASGNGSYSLYLNGEPIHSESKLIWSGTDDAVIFVPKSNTYYELKDYKKYDDGILRNAKVVRF